MHRARAFAGFMLAVFLMRMGIVILCDAHDIAELFGGKSEIIQVATTPVDVNPGLQGDATSPDHCVECCCHHGVTLSPLQSLPSVHVRGAVAVLAAAPLAEIALPREVRPPIV